MTPEEIAAQAQRGSPTDLPYAFDLGYSPVKPDNIQLDLQMAQDALTHLRSQLQKSIVTDVAQSAVTTDGLKARIGANLAGQLTEQGTTLQTLQRPIVAQIAGDLATTVETTIPMGLIPPGMGVDCTTPNCVAIRQAGLVGDLTPAIEYYRENAFPDRFVRGVAYNDAVDFIRRALPQDVNLQSQFAALVQQMQNEPMSVAASTQSAAAPPDSCVEKLGAAAQQAIDGAAACIAQYTFDDTNLAACLAQVIQRFGISGQCLADFNTTVAGMIGRARSGSGRGGGTLVPRTKSPNVPQPTTPPVAGGPFHPVVPSLPPVVGQPPSVPNVPGVPGIGGPSVPPGGGFPLGPGGGIAIPPIEGGPGVPSVPPGSPGGICPVAFDSAGVPLAYGPCQPGLPSVPSLPVPPGGTAGVPQSPPQAPGSQPAAPGGQTGVVCGPPPGSLQNVCDAALAAWQDNPDVSKLRATLDAAGIDVGPDASTGPCPPGYYACLIPVGPGDNAVQLCLRWKCRPIVETPQGGCCPVNVVVNCPPSSPLAEAPKPPKPGVPEQPRGGGQPAGAVQQVPIAGCAEFGPAPGVAFPEGLGSLSQALGLRDASGALAGSGLFSDTNLVGNVIARNIITFFVQALDSIASLGNSVITQSGCSDGQQLALIGTSIIVNALRNFVGDSLDGVRVPNMQQRNYRCPTALPNTDEATIAFLGNNIDETTLECWVRACGDRYPEFKRVIDARRTKLSPLQYATLYMRDKINVQQYSDAVRSTGMIRDSDPQAVLDLLQVVPPPSDLIRMMVRDAADENLVQQFRLDDLFPQKFAGQLRDWARNQGVPEKYMQFLWRAHWSIPSPGQLFDMLHRLSRRPQDDPAHIDESTIRAALVQQDIAPFWIDKFLAISYRPLSRIDARRAFQVGAIDRGQLKGAWLDQGYNDQNAEILTDFTDRQRILALLRTRWVGMYAKSEITLEDFTRLMVDEGARESDLPRITDRAQRLLKAQSRKRCIAAYRKRFLAGEFDSPAAIAAVQQQGIDPDAALSLVSGWQCEVKQRGKEFSASQICELYTGGFVDEGSFITRLKNVGYDHDDAVILLRNCQRRNAIKADAKQATELRRQQAESQRLQRQIQRQAAADARSARQAASALQKANNVRQLREKRLIAAGQKFSETAGISLPDGVVAVKSVFNGLISSSPYTADEVIAAISAATGDSRISTVAGLAESVAAALSGAGLPA